MPFLIAALIIIALLLTVQLIVFLILGIGFSRRSDNDPNLRYFTAHDFPELTCEAISFHSGNNMLRGFIYDKWNQKADKLMLFLMGIGAGHHAYMHVIKEIAVHGYRVLAFDYTGAQLSQGRSIKGLPQPLIDLQAAFAFIENRDDLKDLPLDVIGHSWGGYVAGIAPLLNEKIRRVVSISGFNSVPTVLSSIRPYMKVFEPFVDFANLLKFGKVGVLDITSSIKHANIPMLFMMGAKDPFVRQAANFDKYRLVGANKPSIEFYLDADKSHNPYLTSEAEQYFISILKEKRRYDKNPQSDESQAFYRSIDYELITRNDPEFFEVMFEFLDREEVTS
jgi:pimeloyl-ACP methyl ester carboxylesterase